MRRNRFLQLAVLLTMSLVPMACAGVSEDAASSQSSGVASSDSAPGAILEDAAGETVPTPAALDCVATPSQTEGPYYFDTGELRRDITESKPGTPLLVSLRFVDANTCEPIPGATVDVWHTDHMGVYSGYPDQGVGGTTGETFLRGKQVTDADGLAEFETIYPGWYPTRAVHIHYMAYTDERHLITSQLYFPDAVSEAVYRTEPYAARGPHPVTNDGDGIFPGDTPGDSQIGHITENDEGYTVSLTVGVGPGSGDTPGLSGRGRRG